MGESGKRYTVRVVDHVLLPRTPISERSLYCIHLPSDTAPACCNRSEYMIFMHYTYSGNSAIILTPLNRPPIDKKTSSVLSTSTNYCNTTVNNVYVPSCNRRLECQLRQTNLIVTPFPAFPAPQEGNPIRVGAHFSAKGGVQRRIGQKKTFFSLHPLPNLG